MHGAVIGKVHLARRGGVCLLRAVEDVLFLHGTVIDDLLFPLGQVPEWDVRAHAHVARQPFQPRAQHRIGRNPACDGENRHCGAQRLILRQRTAGFGDQNISHRLLETCAQVRAVARAQAAMLGNQAVAGAQHSGFQP